MNRRTPAGADDWLDTGEIKPYATKAPLRIED
jgi:hypothetical protein